MVMPYSLFSRRLAARRSAGLPVPAPPAGVALVLSGGSVFGAVQVGQVRALLEAGFAPDLVVGCSVGAINGAFLAGRMDVGRTHELEEIWLGLRSRDVFDIRPAQTLANVVHGRDHLCTTDNLRSLIERFGPTGDLSELATPLEVVTTDLDLPGPCWWRSGPAVEVLSASAALPGIFPAVVLDGHRHVDGGVLVPVPLVRAVESGARDIFVCDVSARSRPHLPARLGALSALLEAFNVARFATEVAPALREGQRVTVLPTPDLAGLSMLDFRHTRQLVADAHRSSVEALATLDLPHSVAS